MKRRHFAAVALALALLIQGCAERTPSKGTSPEKAESGKDSSEARGNETPAPETSIQKSLVPEQYSISLNTRTSWTVDRNGKDIPLDRQFTVLFDVMTNLPQCQKLVRVEDTGEKTEYGTPITRTLTALYDMDGNLLRDWEEISYDAGFGDFLIRYEDPNKHMKDIYERENDKSDLWNYKTGETLFDKVDFLDKMDDSTVIMMWAGGSCRGIVNREGKVTDLSKIGESYDHLSPWNGYYIASVQRDYSNTDYLLDKDFQQILSRRSLSGGDQYKHSAYGGKLFLCYWEDTESGREAGILSVPEGEVLFSLKSEDTSISYFDGERVIGSTEKTALYSVDGTKLSGDYEDIIPTMPGMEYGAEPAEAFLGVENGKIDQLDREGKVVKSLKLPGIQSVYGEGGGLYSCGMNDGKSNLINGDLEFVVEPGKYQWVQVLSDWNGMEQQNYDFLKCAYYADQKQQIMRFDLCDLTGKPVIEGLSEISSSGPDRLMVKKGFRVGLMDWKGNWIVEKSIFSDLNEDYDPWAEMF